MKIVHMLKTMAGPDGVTPVGKTMTVDEVTAAQLVEAEAAEVIATVAAPVSQETVETAAVDPVVETATRPKAKKKAV